MPWYDIFDDTFFLSFGSMVFACAAICIRYGYRSKCHNVSLCFGALYIERDVQGEEQVDQRADLRDSIDTDEDAKSNLEISKKRGNEKV